MEAPSINIMTNIIQSIVSNKSYRVVLNNVLVQADEIDIDNIVTESIKFKEEGNVIEYDTKDGFHYVMEVVKKISYTELTDPKKYTYADMRLYSYMFQVDDFETKEEWIDYILESEKYQLEIISKEQVIRAFINMYNEVVGKLSEDTIKIFMDKLD